MVFRKSSNTENKVKDITRWIAERDRLEEVQGKAQDDLREAKDTLGTCHMKHAHAHREAYSNRNWVYGRDNWTDEDLLDHMRKQLAAIESKPDAVPYDPEFHEVIEGREEANTLATELKRCINNLTRAIEEEKAAEEHQAECTRLLEQAKGELEEHLATPPTGKRGDIQAMKKRLDDLIAYKSKLEQTLEKLAANEDTDMLSEEEAALAVAQVAVDDLEARALIEEAEDSERKAAAQQLAKAQAILDSARTEMNRQQAARRGLVTAIAKATEEIDACENAYLTLKDETIEIELRQEVGSLDDYMEGIRARIDRINGLIEEQNEGKKGSSGPYVNELHCQRNHVGIEINTKLLPYRKQGYQGLDITSMAYGVPIPR